MNFTANETDYLEKLGFKLDENHQMVFGEYIITKFHEERFWLRVIKYGYDVDGDYGRGDTVWTDRSFEQIQNLLTEVYCLTNRK